MLARYLGGAGYQVTTSTTTARAREVLRGQRFDLLLLDINLPDGDGVSLAHELRQHSTAGIIFVTQRSSDVDRILGLESAGDDYVTKPVHLRELLARVRALLRRQRLYREVSLSDTVLVFDGWVIDLRLRELAPQGGDALSLTHAEFDLLAALVMAPGKTLDRVYLQEVVSKKEHSADARTVDTLVARLRRKMSQASGDRQCPIRTVVGVGYRLDAKVSCGS
jgi:two-component system torCAD operon response regulator TorR